MIDFYGRVYFLGKVVVLMEKIFIKVDVVLWGVFLNVCKMKGNVESVREVEEKLLRIEGESGLRYV